MLRTIILLAGVGASGLLAASAGSAFPGAASRTLAPVQEDTTKKIYLLNAETMTFVKQDSVATTHFKGNVVFRQGTSYLYCDSAVRKDVENVIEAYGKVHINQDDSVHTYSDRLHFSGNTRIATLTGNAKLTDNKVVLTSPELTYDMNTKIGTYNRSGKLVNGESVLTSQEGIYYAETKDVFFKKEVVIVDPGFTLSTDTLLYNSGTKVATILAPTTINDGKAVMYVTSGFYNTETGFGNFGQRPVIEDSTNTFTADEIRTDKATGISIAMGNMIWRDTVQKMAVLANYGVVDQRQNTVMATRKPVMLLEGKSDTLFVRGDTLFSGVIKPAPPAPVADSGSTFTRTLDRHEGDTLARSAPVPATPAAPADTTEKRFIIAYHNVKIFSDSLQGVADSVYYSGVDSIFRLYRDPVLWANGNQLLGDTIFLFTRNQKADRLLLDQNALIINEAGPNMYNQIKGNTVMGYFSNDKIDSMYVNGNAENIYYVQDDDSAYISINRLMSAATHVYFLNGELDRIVFVKEPEATMYPFTQMPDDQKRLSGFRWEIHRRPKSKYELLGQ
ncbi:OstA-like protein [Chitinophaga lutea]